MSEQESRCLRGLRDWVHERLGIHFTEAKLDILAQRLQRLLFQEKIESIEALHQLVVQERRQELYLALAQCVATNHTQFFREPRNLETLKAEVFPRLEGEDKIRVWSAAVSSGEEAYTLGMLFLEHFGVSETTRRLSILGTDISPSVLARAEKGVYDRRSLQFVPEEFQTRYFRPRGLGQFEVRPELRSLCTFRRLNLKSRPWPFRHRFHLIFLRNVLYYFDALEQRATVESAHAHIRPGGWLFTSATESLRGLGTSWRTTTPGVHRARAERAPELDAALRIAG